MSVSSPPTKIQRVSVQPFSRLSRAKAILGDQYLTYVAVCFVALLIGGIVPIVLIGPMMCGMFVCFRERMLGRPGGFDGIFKGFDKFAESLIASLVQTAISMVVIIPVYMVFAFVIMFLILGIDNAQNGPPSAGFLFGILAAYGGLFLTLGVLIALISVPFTFVFPLVIDKNMQAMEAIGASWKAAKMNFMGIFYMHLLHMFIAGIAALCCYLPAFLFMPLAFGATYTLYQDIFGISNANPLMPAYDPPYAEQVN